MLVFFLNKAIIIPSGPTIDLSKFAPDFTLQMDFISLIFKVSLYLPMLLFKYFLYFLSFWVSMYNQESISGQIKISWYFP